jgi:hypothetical protein
MKRNGKDTAPPARIPQTSDLGNSDAGCQCALATVDDKRPPGRLIPTFHAAVRSGCRSDAVSVSSGARGANDGLPDVAPLRPDDVRCLGERAALVVKRAMKGQYRAPILEVCDRLHGSPTAKRLAVFPRCDRLPGFAAKLVSRLRQLSERSGLSSGYPRGRVCAFAP